ncbi:MAG: M23 family metallopeptidase [Clostridiales bacterium]|nr:M23 family metallopeptidase [Clostridiales bacterium]
MQEQKDKEMEKDKDKNVKKAKRRGGERRFYMLTAIGCAVALAAIVIVAVAVSGKNTPVIDNQVNNEQPLPDDNGNNEKPTDTPTTPDDEQVSGEPEGMIAPVQSVTVSQEHGFHHNVTLDCYYEHQGLDFAAEVGTEVLAVEDGVIESVYKEDLLVGTQITIDHGDGVKSVYCFVTEAEGLKAGDVVKKGDVIATVAEATGKEYKQGAHLHFEVIKNNVSVDPAGYLPLEEK